MNFPEMSAAQVHAATAERWDTSNIVPLPRPGWLRCPVCGTPDPQPRWWQHHSRPAPATIPYRCDVSLKCVSCAALWMHGVALDEAAWSRRPNPVQSRVHVKLTWRQVRELIGGDDGTCTAR